MNNKKKSFSLVELLVVIAIVGIISAVAVPSYKRYITKAKISEAMYVVNKVNNIIREYYIAEGTLPSDAILARELEATASGNLVNLNLNNVDYVNISSNSNSKLYYSVKLNFDVGEAGRTTFFVATKADLNSINFKCGIWNISSPSSWHINDPDYLPSGCNATNVGAFFSSS